MDSLTLRTVERFSDAVKSLEAALKLQVLPEHAERDAALLRFELAAELMPKALRRFLIDQGVDAPLPKDTVRAALAAALIDDTTAVTLISAIDDRNRMVHDYSRSYSEHLHGRVRNSYFPALDTLVRRMHEEAAR